MRGWSFGYPRGAVFNSSIAPRAQATLGDEPRDDRAARCPWHRRRRHAGTGRADRRPCGSSPSRPACPSPEVHVVARRRPRDSPYAPMWSLYGVLSFENRTSLFGRNTWNGPNSAELGEQRRPSASDRPLGRSSLLASQKVRLLSAASRFVERERRVGEAGERHGRDCRRRHWRVIVSPADDHARDRSGHVGDEGDGRRRRRRVLAMAEAPVE